MEEGLTDKNSTNTEPDPMQDTTTTDQKQKEEMQSNNPPSCNTNGEGLITKWNKEMTEITSFNEEETRLSKLNDDATSPTRDHFTQHINTIKGSEKTDNFAIEMIIKNTFPMIVKIMKKRG